MKRSSNGAKLVPFLRKLQLLCEYCETNAKEVARWSADGTEFLVLDNDAFSGLLKQHFEGQPATFHRQLHFYAFAKVDALNGGGNGKNGTWSFRHPHFLRDEPSKIFQIKRYARASQRDDAITEDESKVDVLEHKVSVLQRLVDDLSRKLAQVQLELKSNTGQQQPTEEIRKSSRKRIHKEEDVNSLASLDFENLFEEDNEDMAMDVFLNDDEKEQMMVSDVLEDVKSHFEEPTEVPPAVASPTSDEEAVKFLTSMLSNPFVQKVLKVQKEAGVMNAEIVSANAPRPIVC